MESKSNSNQNPYVRASTEQTSSSAPVMRPLMSPKKGVSGGKVFFIVLLMVIIGVGVGYGASFFSSATGTSFVPAALNPNAPAKGKIFGSSDTTTFKDTADGQMQNGGLDGDGEYHLVRSGGPSQYVYLTSSTLDLSQFVGQKIKVWG